MAVRLVFDEQAMQTVQAAFADDRYWKANESASTSEREWLKRHARFIGPFQVPGMRIDRWPHTFFADRALILITSLGKFRDLLVAEGDLETAAHVTDLGRSLQSDFLAEGGKEQLEKTARHDHRRDRELVA
jgi:hypothetical protein